MGGVTAGKPGLQEGALSFLCLPVGPDTGYLRLMVPVSIRKEVAVKDKMGGTGWCFSQWNKGRVSFFPRKYKIERGKRKREKRRLIWLFCESELFSTPTNERINKDGSDIRKNFPGGTVREQVEGSW